VPRLLPPAAVLAAGLLIRAYFAPFTAGSDVVQFAGFADSVHRHGLCFYKYAGGENAEAEGWAYPWPFPYGPLAVALLAVARLLAPGGVEKVGEWVYAPPDWIAASKALFIAFDTAVAVLMYASGAEWPIWRRTAAMVLYYLNPAVIYTSAIYGMLDPVPAALLVAALRLRGGFWAGVLLGLAAATKPNAAPAALFAAFALPSLRLAAGFAAGALVPVMPFEAACPGSLSAWVHAALSVALPGYNPPVVYSFNGVTTLATYLHEKTGGDYLWAIRAWWIAAAAAYAPLLLVARRAGPLVSAYLAYLAYTATYWRVNYQYLLPLAGLAALHVAAPGVGRAEKAASLAHLAAVALWPFLYPVSWWARVHVKEPNEAVAAALDAVSLKLLDPEVYVAYSLALTALAYVALAVHYRRLFKRINP